MLSRAEIRRSFLIACLFVLSATAATAQVSGAYRSVTPIPLPLDRSGVWTLNFAYTPPRIVEVNTNKGKKTVWYMVYQVWNKSDTPQQFVPEFELVTKDGQQRAFLDEPYPGIVKQINAIEDPTGALNIKTSVSMAKEKIPVTKEDSIPRAIYGLAVWIDAPKVASESNNFSVYITGLSNGLSVEEKEAGKEQISRKTLRLDFNRPTDSLRPMQDDIKPSENNGKGASTWIYRPIPADMPTVPDAKKN